jgi:isoleucyl-tRNA synthetase
MAEMRRCGAHQVILPDGSILQQAVVEIQEGKPMYRESDLIDVWFDSGHV